MKRCSCAVLAIYRYSRLQFSLISCTTLPIQMDLIFINSTKLQIKICRQACYKLTLLILTGQNWLDLTLVEESKLNYSSGFSFEIAALFKLTSHISILLILTGQLELVLVEERKLNFSGSVLSLGGFLVLEDTEMNILVGHSTFSY